MSRGAKKNIAIDRDFLLLRILESVKEFKVHGSFNRNHSAVIYNEGTARLHAYERYSYSNSSFTFQNKNTATATIYRAIPLV